MIRVLVAAEGESDEVVAEEWLKFRMPEASIVHKRFPARGFSKVKQLLTDVTRAAHFGCFDLLVIHFDLDDTLPAGAELDASPRWREVRDKIRETLSSVKSVTRRAPLQWALMAPKEATEAWLMWGVHDQDGASWEASPRALLKEKLFGRPAVAVVEKTRSYVIGLLQQAQSNPAWPLTLRRFDESLPSLP